MCLRIKAFALTGRGNSTMRKPQGVASLALGYVHHWAFSPSLLNPKLQYVNKYVKLYVMYVLALSDHKQMLKTCCCRGLQTRPPIRQRKCSYLSNIP